MRDRWYGDNRDLIKWGGIKILCKDQGINKVLWVAYLRHDKWSEIKFDDPPKKVPVSYEVIAHFKSIRQNMSQLRKNIGLDIILVDEKIGEKYSHQNRINYMESICGYIEKNSDGNKVVFLDPDTGLEPKKCKVTNVSENEVERIWNSLKAGNYLVFYQHRFRDKRWREKRGEQLAKICHLSEEKIRMWYADDSTTSKHLAKLAGDVVFYFIKKD